MATSSHYNQVEQDAVEQQRIENLLKAHIEGRNRMIDDFVLTGAARPLGEGSITPVEGYRVTDVEKDGSVFFIVAAVSAEKIWNLLLSMIELLGDTMQMAILNNNTNDGKSIDYITDEMDRYVLLDLLQTHRDLVLNDGGVEICFFSAAARMEMRLDACKHFQIYVADLVPIIDLLHDFDISAVEDIRFFPEGAHFTFFPQNGEQELKSLLEKLTIVQTNTYDNERKTDS